MSNSAERRLLRDLRKMQNDPPQAVVVTDELFLYQSMLIFLLWNSWKSWWVKKAVTYNTDVLISQLIWSLLFLFFPLPISKILNNKFLLFWIRKRADRCFPIYWWPLLGSEWSSCGEQPSSVVITTSSPLPFVNLYPKPPPPHVNLDLMSFIQWSFNGHSVVLQWSFCALVVHTPWPLCQPLPLKCHSVVIHSVVLQ